MHIRLENIKTPDTDECEIEELSDYLSSENWKWIIDEGQ